MSRGLHSNKLPPCQPGVALAGALLGVAAIHMDTRRHVASLFRSMLLERKDLVNPEVLQSPYVFVFLAE